MANHELSDIVEGQLIEILAANNLADKIPVLERYRKCQAYIERAKEALLDIPEFNFTAIEGFFSSEPQRISFPKGENIFVIDYYKREGANIEENLSITINKERIRFHTYHYENERVNSQILYYDDYPDFVNPKFVDLPRNELEALRMLTRLEEENY